MDDGGGTVGDGQLVVAGRDIAPLLDQSEGALDDVAILVGIFVEGGRPSTRSPFAFTGGDLVALVGDHGSDFCIISILRFRRRSTTSK